jgi:transposase InsO family protein
MAAQGIRGASRAKKRFTTKADPGAVRAADPVNRDFTAAGPDRLWVADFTYSAQCLIMCREMRCSWSRVVLRNVDCT